MVLDGGVLGPVGSLRSAPCQRPRLKCPCIYSASFKLLKGLESARRRLSYQKSKKLPTTTEILIKFLQSQDGSLVDTKFMAVALLAYTGFSNYLLEGTGPTSIVRLPLYQSPKPVPTFVLELTLSNTCPKPVLPASLMVTVTSCLGMYKLNPVPSLPVLVPRFHALDVVKFCKKKIS